MKKNKEGALRKSALGKMYQVFYLIVGVCCVFLSSCAQESRNTQGGGGDITPLFDERFVNVETEVDDTLVWSKITFEQKSFLVNKEEGIEKTSNPYTYFDVKLSKERIEVASKDKLPVKLVKEYISSKKAYEKGLELGEDVVKIFEFDDGQVATCSYGYRFERYVNNNDTIGFPHVEIVDVSYNTHSVKEDGLKTDTEDPYRVDLFFNVSYLEKNVSGIAQKYSVTSKPWYKKFIVNEPTTVIDVSYKGEYEGCPISGFNVVESVTTNKGSFVNSYRLPLNYQFSVPETREQPTLDSIFSSVSTGKKMDETVFSEVKNSDGFTVRTVSGRYVSSNKGQKAGTFVESSIGYTYETPLKLETEYGTYDIKSLDVSFEELGFEVSKIKETDEEISFKSINYVAPKFNDCVLDELEEEVILKLALEKEPDVVKVDSIYTLKGNGDEYTVEKKIIWNDGSTSTSEYTYTGSHSIEKVDFGDVITTSLEWKDNDLVKKEIATRNDEKKFSSSIYFSVVYTTNSLTSNASNGVESGKFVYKETTPLVSFIDGKIRKEFKHRGYSITSLGAKLDKDNASLEIKDAVSYDVYNYDHSISYSFDGEKANVLVSDGRLLMVADVEGEPKYETSQTWDGNTLKVKVKKTIPHSIGGDEEIVYETSYTISLTELEKSEIYADNKDFSATQTLDDTKSTNSQDGFFVIKNRERKYSYKLSNGVKERVMSTYVKDAEIVFDDGTFKKTFDCSLDVSKSESFATAFVSGEYNVYPHKLKVVAKTKDDKKSLSTTGTTDIYVPKPKASYEKQQTWSGNTTTLIVKKTLEGKTESFKTTFTISLQDLEDGDVYADDNAFSVSKKEISNASSSSKDGHFTISKRTRKIEYKVSNSNKSRTMTTEVVDGKVDFDNGEYSTSFDVYLSLNETENLGQTTVSGEYNLTKLTLDVKAKTVDNKTLSAQGITNIYVKKPSEKPEEPNLGKPKSFVVTATYDPSSKVTRRAFCFTWEEGVTYAVCDYETMLPLAKDFMYKVDAYGEYNSVAKNKQGEWVPARGVDANDAMRWYDSKGSMVAGIDKAVSCKAIGWKNVSNGKYALVIGGYSYEIDGYTIYITAPNGEKVSFNSHYTK